MIYTCRICNIQFQGTSAVLLKQHIETVHQMNFLDYMKQYEPEKGGYCKTCGKETRYVNYNVGFKPYCSIKCSRKSEENQIKRKQTCLKRYGVENPFQAEECKNKIQKSMIEKYGAKTVLESNILRDKVAQTNLNRYGVENPFNSKAIQEKIKKTLVERYGVEHPIQCSKIHQKMIDTNLNRYGVENPFQIDKIQEKIKKTLVERYGVENSFQSPEVKEKIKKTMLKNYGVERPLQSSVIFDKTRQTCLEKFGVQNPFQSEECKEKIKQTNLERYGTEYASQSAIVKNKILKTIKSQNYDIFVSKLLKIKNIQLLDSKDDFVNSKIHHYHCNIHNVDFESTGTNYQIVVCPKCKEEHSSSVGENMLFQWLSQYIPCEQHNRTILEGKELDIYIPSKRIAIEFDGLYWHSNENVKPHYHLEKTIACEKKGVQLIHVFENEWIEKSKIVKSVILAKLGIFKRRIYARRCELMRISDFLYKDFLEENHLQGYVPAHVKIGLFYNRELVQVCSFDNSRYHKNEIELLRQCTLLNTQVIGGFSKIVKRYVLDLRGKNLVTYCDRRYSNGSGYLNSDWTLIKKTPPNYFYFKGSNLESRLKYQKHKLSSILESFDEDLTEQENMCKNGYLWIYDCGNLKLKFNWEYDCGVLKKI